MHTKMHLFKIVLILVFLIMLTMVSFEKEKEYVNEELNADIISNTAPDIVNHEDKYTISITVKNKGGGIWTNAEGIKLCIWQDGFDWGYRIDLAENVQVESGEEYTFLLEGFSLSEKNSTKLEFQMIKEGVTYFGEREAVEIRVAE